VAFMGLFRFCLKRLALLIPVLLGVTVLTFVIARVAIPDPARAWAGLKASQATVEAIRARYHLNDPIYVQYFYYILDLLSGDWGTSPVSGQPVLENLAGFFPATLELSIMAIIIAAALGIPMGVQAAVKQDKPADHAIRLFSLGTYCIPPFLMALVMQLVVFYWLRLLPSGGRISPFIPPPQHITGLFILDSILTGNVQALESSLVHILLPASALALLTFGVITRLTRSSMLEVLKQDYVRTARSKGLSERVVVFKHALRNGLISVITVLALLFATMLSGAIVIEYIFNWPGIGRYAVQSILALDLPAVMGTTLLFALIVVVVNLVADIAYAILDPRIRLD
jgi:ABC-type dipeptide/oligopeptide/nickel transport system permease component